MPRFGLLKIGTLALLLLGRTALAQDVVEIDKIVIQKPSALLTLPKTTGQIRFADATPAPFSLSQSLRRQAGVSLTQYGGLTAETTVSIRGANSQHLQIVWDGIPLGTASGQGLQIQNIPASQVQKIEIYKSQTPAGLGSANASGTLAITTKPITTGVQIDANATLGSFGTRTLGLQTSYGAKQHSLALGLDFLTTDGDFAFFDDNGTPKNTADDQTTTRHNNFSKNGHLHARWDFFPNARYRLTGLAHGFTIHKGVPGLQSYQSESAELTQYESLATIKWETTPEFSKTNFWQNQTYARWILTQFSDPNGEIGLGRAQQTHDTTLVLGNKSLWQHRFAKAWQTNTLLHYTYESFLPQDQLNTSVTGSTSQRHQIVAAFEPEWTTWHDTLTITAKLQPLLSFYQINDDDPSRNAVATFSSHTTKTDWTAALNAQKQISESFTLKGAFAREVRHPLFVEMFGDQGFVLGNPHLKPESSLKGELGFVWQAASSLLRFESAAFGEWARDLIEFEIRNGVAQAENLGQTRVLGVETFLHAEPWPFLTTNLSYTWLNPRDLNNGRNLIGRPQHNVRLALGANIQNFSATSDWGFEDGKSLDSLNNKVVRNRINWDLELAYRLRDQESLSLEAKNLTDSQIEDAIGFPLPGRSFFLKWQRRW